MSSNNIPILYSLDPDDQKASFIAFLKASKPQYSDYDFSGSNWNVLLDVLGQNSWKQAFYNNMSFSEGFADSAQLRDSQVSIAKRMNYIPGSMTSSSTELNITLFSNNITSMTIPTGTAFVGTNPNGTFMFRTNEVLYQSSTNGVFSFNNVPVYEGNFTNDAFTYISGNQNPLYTLSNPSIDISSLTVAVTQDNGSNTTLYSQAIDIYGLNGNSTVFYLQGTSANQYQIEFGDGILGYKPPDGSLIQAQYRVTFGPQADGIGTFALNDNIAGFNGGSIQNTVIVAISNTSGGTNNEDANSISFNAPLYSQTLDRAVTAIDYNALIKKRFAALKDVNVYKGGVSSANTQIGTVIIAAVSSNGGPITSATKDSITSYLANLEQMHISTQFSDANTIYLQLSTNVHVNFSLTNNTQAATFYQQIVANSTLAWSNNNLEGFNKNFRRSVFTTNLNNLDPSIISNETTVGMRQAFPIALSTNTNFIFTFNNPIEHVTTNQFLVNGNISYISDILNESQPDLANGTVYLLNTGTNGNTVINSTPIGVMNYDNGNVSITTLSISGYLDNTAAINFYALPLNQDIYATNNFILEFDPVPANNINIISG